MDIQLYDSVNLETGLSTSGRSGSRRFGRVCKASLVKISGTLGKGGPSSGCNVY